MSKLVSEDYPWSKLWREYAMYCFVGTFNVTVFFLFYSYLYKMNLSETYPSGSAWAITFIFSTWQSHFTHKLFTFESTSNYKKSLYTMFWIYAVGLVISTASQSYFADTLGINHYFVWACNTAALGFISFLALRIYAFPLSDGRITRQERLEDFKERRRA
ncbi:MAG: hypothetical protein HN534_06825 [Euryarchaeota archaeon]|jgi:putative flippase GtrA|nr:hypothetical protein [Euryarchaeota archaeon]MBT3654618.1 hypothetical protein [Euryarchaeota archaeon]MBT3757251.1 hypothetical protein [Euryarchaeota archaeon]MBT4051288.1 hypothetical protein [Euryarchaeota archaeon]MBT4346804.1 hypothetical protein [Euryarchaeota archaeon]|tara:strand:+ start:2470 stop:2949 length:480 start_codon:yes stop_codon:yes gene_type:complete